MSYTPTEWATGDIVTADKLNKLENGVASATGGGGALIVKCTGTAVYEAGDDGGYWNIPVDTSFADIFAAMESGPVYISVPLLSTTEPYYEYRNDGKVLLPVYIIVSNGVEYSGKVFCPSDMSLGGADAQSISLTEFNDVGETLEIMGDISQ